MPFLPTRCSRCVRRSSHRIGRSRVRSPVRSLPQQVTQKAVLCLTPHHTTLPTRQALPRSAATCTTPPSLHAALLCCHLHHTTLPPRCSALLPLAPHRHPHMSGALSGRAVPRYRLLAVVSHHGASLSGGHYTCDVRSRVDDGWRHCDDSQVHKVPLAEVLRRQAYVLFYELEQ